MESTTEQASFLLQPWLMLITAATVYSLVCVVRALLHPLRDVPGPVLARFTRLWYLRAVNKGNFEMKNIELHRTHGVPVPSPHSHSRPRDGS
jgi:hypothetical protein